MVCTVHNKFNACGNLTELSDNELVIIPIIKMRNMAFKFRIGNIGEVSDNNIRIRNCRLNIDFFFISGNRMNRVWIGNFSVFNYASSHKF